MTRLLFILSFSLVTFVAVGQSIVGTWQGTVTYRNAELPIQLYIRQSGDSFSAKGCIPQLVYYDQDWPITGGNSLTLPFGLGEFMLSQNGDSLVGQQGPFRLGVARTILPDYHQEEVTWKSDAVRLSGTIYLPDRDPPYPAVVLTHGANAGTRSNWNYQSWAFPYLEEGFAVLLYDRRGEGQSTGVHDDLTTLYDLRDDLLGGIALLREQQSILPEYIGIGGGSQAGYLAFMAAAVDTSLAFLALRSASSQTLDQGEITMVRTGMLRDSLSWQSVHDAEAYMRRLFAYVQTGDGWQALQAATDRIRDKPWADYIGLPTEPSGLTWWRGNVPTWKPDLILPKLTLPVLLQFGEEDVIVPPHENGSRFSHLLRQTDLDLFVYSDCGHSLELPAGTDAQGTFQWFAKHPDMLKDLRLFLRKQKD